MNIDKYDVWVYTYEDKEDNNDLLIKEAKMFKNINLIYKVPYVNEDVKMFNKAKLLDTMLQDMRHDYDWWSLFDLD